MSFWKSMTVNWGKKLLSLLLAAGLYIYVNLTMTSERVFNIPLRVKNSPGFLMTETRVPATVRVRASGPPRQLTLVEPGQISAEIDMATARRGANSFVISLDYPRVDEGVRFVPESQVVQLVMDRPYRRVLPVKPVLLNKPAAGFQVRKITVVPEQVTVIGAERIVTNLQALNTEAVNIGGTSQDLQRTVQLNLQDLNLKLLHSGSFSLAVDVAPIPARRVFDGLPVHFQALSGKLRHGGAEIPKVSLRISGPKLKIGDLDTDDISITVNCSNINRAGEYLLPVIVRVPEEFQVEQVVPARIQIKFVKEPVR